ncbi:MAG: nucleotidyl transferase AbiEii/AbiGii toxin family protein [Draconibacterium sp.]|nr:nucleotidyl transferase AbiEii/AbiGii toxin family protein [Draconibacterium sp.]
MLYKETIEPGALKLIRDLQKEQFLESFLLAGGTSLALQIGHRKSIDIDLFSRNNFDAQMLSAFLEEKYNFSEQYIYKNTLKGIINGVFVDIITHNYPLVDKPETKEGINLISIKDIAAMKINAISGNGTRVKDFIDIFFILDILPISEIMKCFSIKYKRRNEFHAFKSLTYFNDIETSAWPVMLANKDIDIDAIKHKLIEHSKKYIDGLI